MNAVPHPALDTDHDDLPTLTLVLPPGLGQDDILSGLAAAIAQVRRDVAARIRRFQQRMHKCAAVGDELGLALCRGQVLGGEHAAAAIDEAIVAVFDLWRQYEAQLSAAVGATPYSAPPETQHPAEPVRADCPVQCLRGVLSASAFIPLSRACMASFEPPRAVGDVLRLHQQEKLSEIRGLGPRRIGEIELCLILAGLISEQPIGRRNGGCEAR